MDLPRPVRVPRPVRIPHPARAVRLAYDLAVGPVYRRTRPFLRDEDPDSVFEAVLGVVAGVLAFALTIAVVAVAVAGLLLYAAAYPAARRVVALVDRFRSDGDDGDGGDDGDEGASRIGTAVGDDAPPL